MALHGATLRQAELVDWICKEIAPGHAPEDPVRQSVNRVERRETLRLSQSVSLSEVAAVAEDDAPARVAMVTETQELVMQVLPRLAALHGQYAWTQRAVIRGGSADVLLLLSIPNTVESA